MLPPSPPTREQKKRSSTPALIALSICVFFLFAVILAQATFKLTFFEPDTSEQTIIVALVSALIFFLFVALTFVLIRTLLRLYAERKTGMLGSKFRSHMVLGALLLSLGPVIFLFLFSYGLLNRSHREVVFASHRRCAVPHQPHRIAADAVCHHECAG